MNLIQGNRFCFWSQMQLTQEAASAHRPWLLFAGSTLLSPARCRMGLVATVQGGEALRSGDGFLPKMSKHPDIAAEMMFNDHQ